MANSEIINLIIQTVADSIHYLLPIIGLLAGLNFIISWLMQVLFGSGRVGLKG